MEVLRERKIAKAGDIGNNLKNEETCQPLYVIIFSQKVVQETVEWLTELLTRSQQDGGAELIVQTHNIKNEGIILEIGASTYKLLEAAETMEVTKEDIKGNNREFVLNEIKDFLKPNMSPDNILSTSEKQRIVLEEIMNLRAMEKKSLKGYQNILLFPGQSLIQVCTNNGIIDSMYPLHEEKELNSLKEKWTFKNFPLNDIRNYFGESVAFYFAFVFYYNWALLLPAFIGFCQTIYSFDITKSHVFFAIFKMIWLTVFLEFWKRRSNELAYTWGTLRLINIPKLHPTFRGKYMVIDPITKLYIPSYPAYKRHLKVYCVSLPLTFLCLILAIVVMLIYFEVEAMMMELYNDGTLFGWIMIQLPGLVYAVAVIAMNILYRYAAYILTEWENHKTQESFDNHRIVKLLLFEFVNNFIAMGYTAFYKQDLDSLRYEIAIMMIVNQLFTQLQETVLPFYLQRHHKKKRRRDSSGLPHRVQIFLHQRDMWSYEETYDDYLAIFIQFGYVFLFSSVFPIAAFIAVLNNIIELRLDGFKLCYAYQRPISRPAKGIGIWQMAFEVLSFLSVMTNCALLCMSPIVWSLFPDLTLAGWILVGISIEHVVIGAKMVIAYLISDVPKWVNVAIQRYQYEALQNVKKERKAKAQLVLSSLKEKIA